MMEPLDRTSRLDRITRFDAEANFYGNMAGWLVVGAVAEVITFSELDAWTPVAPVPLSLTVGFGLGYFFKQRRIKQHADSAREIEKIFGQGSTEE
jgi:hypothetical protein